MMYQTDADYYPSTERKANTLTTLLLSLTLSAVGIMLLLFILSIQAAVAISPGEKTPNNSARQTIDYPPAPATVSVNTTKTVEPPDPDTGDIVSICFTISGLEPNQLDVALTQDVSESMNDPAGESITQTRLAASQEAATAFVHNLADADRAAVVAYSTTAHLALPLTTTKSTITQTIYSLTATGGTNIGEGISVSHKELITSPRYVSDTTKTIILLSDGIATHPGNEETAKQYALERADAAANDNIKIYTIGFGSDADEVLLQDIADATGGQYFFAPDSDALETIYISIALELHNLVIVDILPPGVETNCSQWPPGQCVQGPSGVTTVTLPIDSSSLISGSTVVCLTATVNLDPDYEGSINLPGSGVCYQDSDGQTICEEFDNPTVTVGGRKITGQIFYDVNANGHWDAAEEGATDVVVQTSTGLTTATDVSGSYVLRTSNGPALSLSVAVPSGHVATTAISYYIPPMIGTYPSRDFGIYGGLCVKGKVFDDDNQNGQDDEEEGVAGATLVASQGTSMTTGNSGVFTACAPADVGPITVTEIDPPGYTSTAAISGTGVQVVDEHTLRIASPEAGRVYEGNKFGDYLTTAKLTLAKISSADSVSVGDKLSYTLVYTNVGNAVANNVRLTDELPAGLVYQPPANPSPITYTHDNELIWDLASLDPDGEETVVVTVTVSAEASGQVVSNCVELKSPESSANACTAVRVSEFITERQWSLYLPLITRDYPLPTIINGDFEDGWNGWAHGGELYQAISSTNPYAGSFSALLGHPLYGCANGVPIGSAWMEQIFFVPATESPRLSFRYRIFSQDKNTYLSDQFDSFDVTINDLLVFRDAKQNDPYGCAPQATQDLGWQYGEVSLNQFRGQQIIIRFENRNQPDKWYNTWTFVDDVQFLP